MNLRYVWNSDEHTYLLSKFPGCKTLYGNSQSSLQDMYCSWVQTTACSTGARPLQMGWNIFWSQASTISRVIDGKICSTL